MERLLMITERIAAKDHDGCLTIMSSTTGRKAMFGTPTLDGREGREA